MIKVLGNTESFFLSHWRGELWKDAAGHNWWQSPDKGREGFQSTEHGYYEHWVLCHKDEASQKHKRGEDVI